MDNKKIASDLIKVAQKLLAIEFDSQDAFDKYMKEHPDADKSNHSVKKTTPTSTKQTDKHQEAMKEIGYTHGGANADPETLFDGVTFDPAKPEEYVKSFAVHSMKG
jgi:hypothetical protein